MALYVYQALAKDGKKVVGYIDASTPQKVQEILQKQDLYPISISLAQEGIALPWWKRIFSRSIKIKDKILFTKQLSILLKSGVPLLQALELLTEQFEGNTRSMIVKVKDDIKAGSSLADALKKHPKQFNNIYVQLVRAGEASGKLESILDRLVNYMERQEELRKRVKGALTYPAIQLVVAIAAVAILLIKVVPTMVSQFTQLGGQLPLPTRMLLALSNTLTRYYLFIIAGLVIAFLAIRYWKSTPRGARQWDEIKLRIPLIRYFARMNAIIQFSYTLGMLIASGVNFSQALDIVVDITENRVLADTLSEARDKIVKQGKIAQYLKQTNLFPPIAIYLIDTGEKSGQLDTMLLTVAQTYEDELKEFADGLTALISPILLIVMAIVVGFIVAAIVLPIMQMIQTVNF